MEEEKYYLVLDDINGLNIVSSIEMYMNENNIDVCEVCRFDSIDEALDSYNEAMDKMEELRKVE